MNKNSISCSSFYIYASSPVSEALFTLYPPKTYIQHYKHLCRKSLYRKGCVGINFYSCGEYVEFLSVLSINSNAPTRGRGEGDDGMEAV